MNKTNKILERSVYQHDSADCGVACLISAIRYFGGNSTFEVIRKLSGSTQNGTTMLGLYQAAIASGLEASGYEATIDEITGYESVLILHVILEDKLEHYVVYYGIEGDKFLIWDPAKGLTKITKGYLNKIWQSKKCLGLIPNKNFVLEKDLKREKKKWLWQMIKPEKDLLYISIITGILISVLGLVMAIYTQKLIDKILPSGKINILLITSLIVFTLLSARLILSAIRQFSLISQGRSFNIRIVNDFYNALLYLPKSFFDTRKTGDFVARLNDTLRVQKVIADIAGTYIIDVMVLVVSLVMLYFYSPISATISLLCMPFLFHVVFKWNKKFISLQHAVMSSYAASESNFISSLRGIFDIKCMNWQAEYSTRNYSIYSDFQDKNLQLGRQRIKLTILTGLAGSLYIIVILTFAASQVMLSKITQGKMLAILSLTSTMVPSILNLALLGIPYSEVKVALNRMFEFTKIDPEEKTIILNNVSTIVKITLDGVHFRFPGQQLLLENVNLIIEKGKVVSLIGESGSGKSTLANLILKFYLPEKGRIKLNDAIDIQDISTVCLRSKIGIIPQEVCIFNGTILQNILSEISDEKIGGMISMINDLGLSPFIESYPQGFMTVVGEEGINLSGGQKQILAFIRVLLNEPEILIIDEGTSNMDRDTEKVFVNLLAKLKMRMGILFISHRINIIKQLSEKIYVIEKNRIVYSGTHSQLITNDNLYKRFWDDFSENIIPVH